MFYLSFSTDIYNHVPEIFIFHNLILRTRSCVMGFITQSGWVFHFHLTESVRWKWFVLAVYQFRKGISAGPALKYFTWFIGAGGYHHIYLHIPSSGKSTQGRESHNSLRKRTLILRKRALCIAPKSPKNCTKEVWVSCKRALYLHTNCTKETYILRKRAQHVHTYIPTYPQRWEEHAGARVTQLIAQKNPMYST